MGGGRWVVEGGGWKVGGRRWVVEGGGWKVKNLKKLKSRKKRWEWIDDDWEYL